MATFNCDRMSTQELEKVTSALKLTVLSGFGPSFQHTLVCTQTGRLLVTNNGSQILRTTDVDNPVGKYIISCISHHQRIFGDGSKTFIVMLSELLYRSSLVIRSANDTDKTSEHATRLHLLTDLDYLFSVILPQLFVSMQRYCVRYSVSNHAEWTCGLKSIISGSLNSHLLEYDCSLFSKLLAAWIMGWHATASDQRLSKLLDMLVDNSEVIVIENPGRPTSSSLILSGLLVSRGFCNAQEQKSIHSPDSQAVQFLVMNCQIESIEDSMLDQQTEFQLAGENHQETLSKILGYKRLRTNAFLNLVKQMGINVIITSYPLSTLEKTQCSRYGVATIHSVPEHEVEFISTICSIQVLSSTLELTTGNIGRAREFKEVIYGQETYVHIEPDPAYLSMKPSCLIVSGPTEGISRQMHRLTVDCLKTVRMSLTPANHIQRSSTSALTLSTESLSTRSSSPKSHHASDGGDSGVCLSPNDQTHSTSDHTLYPAVPSLSPTDRISQLPQIKPLSSSKIYCLANQPDPAAAEEEADTLTCIAVGGAFELCLHELITRYLSTEKAGAPGTTALSILKCSLLAVPQLLHTNAYFIAKPRWLSTLEELQTSVRSGKVRSVNPIDGSATITGIHHPLHGKQQLLLDVLMTLRQLLKVERIL